MNNINRSLVKSQAKQIIKEKVFALFLISAIVLFLTNGLSVGVNTYYNSDDLGNLFGPNNSYGDSSSGQNTPEDFFKYFGSGNDEYNNSNDNSSDNPIESFGQRYNTPSSKTIGGAEGPTNVYVKSNIGLNNIGVRSLSILSLILSPLLISLCGLYLAIIKRNPNEQFELGKELKNTFKISFDATYTKKLVVYILRNLFTVLWAILLLIPGIVYHYSTYFAFQIMYENPNIKPSEALRLSKKMVVGNRGELFALDLSFIGWGLLCGITFGIASIYVIPYYMTTQALYYENFKIRALQEGRITQDDFLSQEEKAGNYYESQANAQYYTPNEEQGGNYYYNPADFQHGTDEQSAPQNQESASPFYNPGAASENVPTEQEAVQSGSYPSYASQTGNNDTEVLYETAPISNDNSEPVYYQPTSHDNNVDKTEPQTESQNTDTENE